jgi:predicted SPOUT superfamily RNA methylase MTH1
MKQSNSSRITGGPLIVTRNEKGNIVTEHGWTSIEVIKKTIVNVCYDKLITYNGIVTNKNYVSIFTFDLENEITECELQSLTENLYNGFNSRHKENLCDYNAFDFYSRVYLQLLKLRLKPNKKQELVKREPLKKETKKEDKPKLQFGNFIIRKFIK